MDKKCEFCSFQNINTLNLTDDSVVVMKYHSDTVPFLEVQTAFSILKEAVEKTSKGKTPVVALPATTRATVMSRLQVIETLRRIIAELEG